MRKRLLYAAVILPGLLLLAAVAGAMLRLPATPPALRESVAAHLHLSGVGNRVTAVLLNFRGYDTLLEIAVLLLAVIGVMATSIGHRDSGLRITGKPQVLLQSVTRLVVPLMIVLAGYLLWAGADRPGGAFQGAAVLAAAAVLMYLAGLAPAWTEPGPAFRCALVGGFLVFLAVAAALLFQGALLQYPAGLAEPLILLVETALLASLGLVLAGLFLWLPNENEDPEE